MWKPQSPTTLIGGPADGETRLYPDGQWFIEVITPPTFSGFAQMVQQAESNPGQPIETRSHFYNRDGEYLGTERPTA